MQDQLDDGTILYTENSDLSGFILREMVKTSNPEMRFQAGEYSFRPMQVPVYNGAKVSHHQSGDNIRMFHLHGYGRTRESALDRASNKLIRIDIANNRKRELEVAK